jgi:hypothetical protein
MKVTGLVWIVAVLLAIAAVALLWELKHWWLWRRTLRRWRKDADEALTGIPDHIRNPRKP